MDIGEAGYGAGGVAVVRGAKIARTCSIDAFVQSCKDLGGLESRHLEEAAPDSVEGKLRAVKRVTMPKLIEPPLRERQRLGLVDAEAVVMEPEARTIS